MARLIGLPNRATVFGREFARKLLESQEYKDSLERRIRTDTLHPAVEVQLQHYAWGKPVDKIRVDSRPMPDAKDVANRAQQLAQEALALRLAQAAQESNDIVNTAMEEAEVEPQ